MRPTAIVSEEQLVGLLRGHRESLGIPQDALTDRIGFPDNYISKLEAPDRKYGRRAVWGIAASLNYWLSGLRLKLVIMDEAQADALIAASPEPEPEESRARPYPGRTRERPVVQRTIVRTAMVWERAA